MASALIVPGVQVKTEFEPSPVLSSQTGILGLVGVVDRGPLAPTSIGSFAELVETFGPATRYTMPEARAAFANGVSRAVVARVAPGRGGKASLDLLDDDGEKVATLQARAEGRWGLRLAVKVSQVKTLGGKGVKFVNLETFLEGKVIETLNGLVMDETSPQYFFDRINAQSRVLVAIDPEFQTALPVTLARTALADAESRSAFTTLRAGATDVLRVEAKRAGRAGNQTAIAVSNGQASLVLTGAGNAPSLEIVARQPGPAGTGIRVAVSAGGPDSVNVVVAPPAGAPRSYGPFTTVDAAVTALAADPDVVAEARGVLLPGVAPQAPLARRVTVDVIPEGRDVASYPNLASLAAIAAVNDPTVTFAVVEGATALPDANTTGTGLRGGRNKGPALAMVGDGGPEPLLELVPAPGVRSGLEVSVTRGISSVDNATGVVNLSVFQDDELTETFNDLTMDPDDPGYLPAVLAGSGLVRAIDLFVRSRTTSFPRHMVRPTALGGGTSPLPDDFQEALDRLESAEEVDMVVASVANQLDEAGVRSVHQRVAAHCTKMADLARNRIGIGAVTVAEQGEVASMLDHGDDVRSDHFILAVPAGTEGPVAGLLARQDFFQSPTFKTIASLEAGAGNYSDAKLEKLISGNLLVVNVKRGLGNIVLKGLLTSGRQVNVQRTANKAVRDVKAIADKYIGLLNNEGARNALQQQITAMFLQMQRDGAIVPSTDGKDPAFLVSVFSTQADFANGIVRVDIAIRPVRAIDYVYATILVKN